MMATPDDLQETINQMDNGLMSQTNPSPERDDEESPKRGKKDILAGCEDPQ